ncbi:MAG TPA: trypsin-like peptidase domain-containing protein, partial [Planctomycetota bacterium]|nr:trypsin-like peptidase domain-containing protein [Planctomycetota bacterium]
MSRPGVSEAGDPKPKGSRRAVRAAEAATIFFVAAGFALLVERQRVLDGELAENRAALTRAGASSEARFARIEQTSRSAAENAAKTAQLAAEMVRDSQTTLKRDIDAHNETLVAQSRLLDALETRQEEVVGRTRTELEDRLRILAERLEAEKRQTASPGERFREIQRKADRSVFLVHAAFTYETREDDAWTSREATAWGTAFVVTADGLLVTNKHLVAPWKFDSEMCAMAALGELRIHENSLRLAAWPAGEVCLDKDRRPLFENGFNSARGDLSLVASAPDRNVPRSIETTRRVVPYEVHALDDHDLALLSIRGGPFEPLRLVDGAEAADLKKLDNVLTLGFPRGHTGLEASVAESSATLGVVRKIENTI